MISKSCLHPLLQLAKVEVWKTLVNEHPFPVYEKAYSTFKYICLNCESLSVYSPVQWRQNMIGQFFGQSSILQALLMTFLV